MSDFIPSFIYLFFNFKDWWSLERGYRWGRVAVLAVNFGRKAVGGSTTMNKEGYLSLSEEEQDKRDDGDVISLFPLFYFIFYIFNNNVF